MISFPVSLFLFPYAIFILIIIFFAFVNLKNLVKYRSEDYVAYMATFIFLSGLAFLAYFSYNYLLPINWKEVAEINLLQNGFNF